MTAPDGNITFVSMLVKNPFDPVAPYQRILWLQQLLEAGLRIVLYVDPYYQEVLGQTTRIPGLQIVPVYLGGTEIFIHIGGAARKELPKHRNTGKDTEAFCTLMNVKTELVARAVRDGFVSTPFVAFLDASIAKVLRSPKETLGRLRAAGLRDDIGTVLIPGCRPLMPGGKEHPKEVLWSHICWVFCGGFFVLPARRAMEWHMRCREMVQEFLAEGHLTWEVNAWVAVAERRAGLVTWFLADHNDSMLTVPAEFLTSASDSGPSAPQDSTPPL
jgi:hypothetical protein